MIRITDTIAIAKSEIEERFILGRGPGGQNVNKVASAVQLRFDAAGSPAISATVLARLRRLAGRRMTASGVIVITARRFRSQERNRTDALARLIDLIADAAAPRRHRRPTRPSRGARERRLVAKHRRAERKRTRTRVRDID